MVSFSLYCRSKSIPVKLLRGLVCHVQSFLKMGYAEGCEASERRCHVNKSFDLNLTRTTTSNDKVNIIKSSVLNFAQRLLDYCSTTARSLLDLCSTNYSITARRLLDDCSATA